MAHELDSSELIEQWTLVGRELELVAGKRGPTRLAFGLLLKFYAEHRRFPRGRAELPDEAVAYVARQVDVPAADIGLYDWAGTSKYHRVQVRKFFGIRECTVADADKLAQWLAEQVCQRERRVERVREELLRHCWAERIEPPTAARVERVVASGMRQAELALFQRICDRIPVDCAQRIRLLIAEAGDDPGEDSETDAREVFAEIKVEPGAVSLKTTQTEVAKLRAIRAIGLPGGVLADISPRIVAGWRARAAVERPSHLRDHPDATKLTLLAALLFSREREVTDTLVELLISTVHKINARSEKKVVEEFVANLKRVSGKENILFRITEASVDTPDGVVRDVVFPAAGGEQTLRDLLGEFRSKGTTFRQHKQRVFKASYTNHYRNGLLELIDVLELRSNNSVHRPVLEALELIGRYKAETTHAVRYYARGEHVPIEGVVPADLAELLHRTDKRGRERIQRTVYECAVFQTLRDKLRSKEIWVVGADRWRNPDEDLPADFESRRAENYEALRKPLDPAKFTAELREELHTELTALNDALPGLDWLQITERRSGAIILTPFQAAPEPKNLRRLKAAVHARWGTVPLLDMLTETALRTGCLNAFTPVGTREGLDPAVLFERLLLVLYAYGTNAGIRSVAAGDHRHTEDDLRYTRRRYVSVQACREAARAIANATFAARQSWLWGEGTTAVASDSTHFTAYDQNIFTEWHSRYRRGKRGVLIYWHVEDASMAVHSQLISCSATEVHAMVEGAMRHGTSMQVEGNYVDSHGQSLIGFGITRLLGFDLLPRIKQINQVKLYGPAAGNAASYPALAPALSRHTIRWDLIEQNYDPMVKYATAIRLGTASTEAILRRFTSNVTHPAYAATLELGRVQRSIFVARYLRDRNLQREINAGLNVLENYNGVKRHHPLRQTKRAGFQPT